MRHRRPGTGVAATAVVVAFAALTSCSANAGEDTPDSQDRPAAGNSRTSGPADGTSAPRRTPTPAPTGPCADGTCEIEVAVGDVVVVPERYGLGPIRVTAVEGDTVDMTAPLTGSGYSMAGCNGGGGVSSGSGGGIGMSCDKGVVATVNDAMSLEVVRTSGATAVLRIAPSGGHPASA